jgi:hypothetical protein
MAAAQPKSAEKSAPAKPPGKTESTAASGLAAGVSTAAALEPEIHARIESFFSALKTGKADGAYRKLFEGSVLPSENPEMVAKLTESTTRVLQLTGTVDGAEILRWRPAGRTLREVTCVLNGEKRPLLWRFYFYYGDGRWQILDTNVSTEASGFFDDGK